MTRRPTSKDAFRFLNQLRSGDEFKYKTHTSSGLTAEMKRLRTWQSARMAETYADLLRASRYKSACQFLLTDLYAPRDFSQRDQDIERMHDFMLKFVPAPVLQALTLAIEFNSLSTSLDQTLLQALTGEFDLSDTLTAEQVAAGYRLCDNYEDRVKQIKLFVDVG
ncbi:MAG: hypothetical protein AAF485_13425 [Chloroflexota bacterium]